MKRLIPSAVFALALCTSGVSIADRSQEAEPASIYATAKSAGFTTLAAAVDAAGLSEVLSGDGPFTVFAPTDEAFDKLPEGALESLLADKEALKNVLLYHVVSGEVKAADVVKIDKAEMLNGQKTAIHVKDGVRINSANVVKTDIAAKNGVIHVIDSVLIPPSLSDKKKSNEKTNG